MEVATRSRGVALLGSQRPRVLHRPEFVSEAHAVEAIELAESVGLILDPWQQLSVRCTLAERADGLYAATEVAQLVARQNGKGGWLEAIVLDGLFLVGDPLTLWTAHQFKTSSEAFLRMKGWIDGSDDLRRKVKRMNSAHGEEGIELQSGARLRFIARSKSSGRGFSPQRIIWDEAQELSRLAIEAAMPAMRAQRNKQSIFTGTVPGDEVGYPEHFTRLRDRGRARSGKRLVWMEWSPKGSDDPEVAARIVAKELHDRKHWKASNPGLGIRITPESMADDMEAMDPESAARELLSVWPTLPTDLGGPMDLDRWKTLIDPKARKPKGGVVMVLDVSPDRSTASIGVAGAGRGGRVLLLSRTAAGTDWVVPDVERLMKKHNVLEVCLVPNSQAGILIPDLAKRDIDWEPVTMTEVGQATAAFIDGVNKTPKFWHTGQAELDAAVENARTSRPGKGEVEVWDRKDRRVDITALVATSIAAFRFSLIMDYDVEDSIG